MMHALTLAQLASRCHTTAPDASVSFMRVSTDSRKLAAGDLFVALRGDNHDGHQFLPDIAQRGACGAVVEKRNEQLQLPQLVVDNTTQALGQLGAMNRELFAGPVIGITGSAGKTTVKEMTAAILRQQGDVLVTRGNLNNHLGVPMMLLEIGAQHQFAVIEMGASAVGEIAYVAALAKPDVAVITNVGTAHVGGFGSVERIAAGKSEIYQALGERGVAVANRDDRFCADWLRLNAARRVITFGRHTDADVLASQVRVDRAGRASFIISYRQAQLPIQLQLLGEHNVLNALAAAACALALGITLAQVKQGLEQVIPVAGRMQVKAGMHGATLIDDTYNANPASVRAAINVLHQLPGRRVLVLGDMAELGSEAEVLHADIGEYARTQQLDALVATGPLSAATVRAYGVGAQHFANKTDVAACVQRLLGPETVVLVKGSRSAAMEEVVSALLLQEKLAC